MPKARVYDIAKEQNITSKELVDLLKKNNIEVKSHTSSVDEDDAKRIIRQDKESKASGSKMPNSDSQVQQEQKKPISDKNAPRLNIWREDNQQEKMQRENLQKEVIRQKQMQQQPQRGGQSARGQYGNNTAPGKENENNRKKPEYIGTDRQQRPQQSPGAQQQRPQQSQGVQQQRPQQSPGVQQQRPQQSPAAQQRRPQQTSGTQQQRQQQTSGAQQQRQQQTSGVQQQRPQQASGAQQQRPQQASGAQQRPQQTSGVQQRRPQQSSGTQQTSGMPQQRGQQQRTPQTSRPAQTTRTDSSGRKDLSGKKDSGGQKQTVAQRTQSNQKSSFGQKSTYNQKGQSGQRSHTAMPSIEKPVAPKKHQSKKARAQKAAEAEQTAAAEALIIEQEQDQGIIRLPKMISVKDLAVKLDKETGEVIKALMKRGIMANINQEIDYYNAAQVAEDFECLVDKEEEIDLLEEAFAEEEDGDEFKTERSPVVVVMGHVDHGKTSLLDRIRKANVTVSEAGGITQHIGAYTVTLNGKMVTFLDTPGHEAFTAMRMRGAQVTDIAVLVVAADDGVMPQTIEAINHAKAANVEIIVAINKIDRPSANPDRVKQELAEYGLLSESWGGDTICVEVSAITGDGIDSLLEMITVVAEMKELKANVNKRARGTVIEAMLDKGRGPVATVLVQSGTLSVGDPVVVGATYGKIRAMSDDRGKKLKTAGPSMPVEILGLSEVPLAGDMFYVANGEKHARVLAESVIAKGREEMVKSMPKISLDHLFDQIQSGNVKDLNLVVKADVQGSVEAVKNSLERLSNDEVRIKTIHGGVGAITESDVMLASASNAIIIGFNVRPETPAKTVADSENVDIRLYRIIYNAIEDITAAMKGLLDPVFKEKVIGHAEIRQLFKASGVGTIAGSYVTDGKFTRNAKVRIIRNSKVVYDGTLETLKRFKDDVKEVNSGYECGLLFNKFNDIKEGDITEAYIMEEIPR